MRTDLQSGECFWESVGDSACDCFKCNARREAEEEFYRDIEQAQEEAGRAQAEMERESD